MTWADVAYSYKKLITIDHDLVSSDESGFPILINITDADLADTSNGGHVESSSGYDICFYDSTETTLYDHEIDKYTNTSGLLVVWVNVTSISSTTDTLIYIYYGNPDQTTTQDSITTWDANYISVWHMNDAEDTSHIHDSTTTNTGTKVGAGQPAVSTSGKIGNCQYFDGNNDYIDCGDTASLRITSPECTFSFWINRDNDALTDYIINKVNLLGYGYTIVFAAAAIFATSSDGSNWQTAAVAADAPTGVWTYVVGAHSADIASLYVQGGSPGTDASPAASIIDTTPKTFDICRYYRTEGTAYAKGYVDEVRVSKVERLSGWNLTEYNNQSAPGTFMSFGDETSQGGGGPTTTQGLIEVYLKLISAHYVEFDGTNIERFIIPSG